MKIIAYGSLMNQNSLERSLQRKASLKKVIISDFVRTFNAPFGDYAFLNLKKRKGSVLEVAYFTMSKNELVKFAEREAGSDLIEVKKDFHAFVWPEKYCKTLPVLQSYINVCEKGAQDLSIDLWKGMIKPERVIDDRNNPRYP